MPLDGPRVGVPLADREAPPGFIRLGHQSDRELRRPQRHVDPRGKDRVEEPRRIPHQQQPLLRQFAPEIRVVARDVKLQDRLRAGHQRLQARRTGDRLMEEFRRPKLGAAHGAERGDESHRRAFLVDRDDPEPAVLQAHHDGMPRAPAGRARHAAEMAVHRHALGRRRRVDRTLLVRDEKIIASAGIEHPAGRHRLPAGPTFEFHAVDGSVRLDGPHRGLHPHLRAHLAGVVQQQAVELGALDLIGALQSRHQAVAEIDFLLPAAVRKIEQRAILGDKPRRLDLRPRPDLAQDGVAHRQHRLADPEPGKRAFLDQQGPVVFLPGRGRGAAAARPTSNHEHIIVGFHHYLGAKPHHWSAPVVKPRHRFWIFTTKVTKRAKTKPFHPFTGGNGGNRESLSCHRRSQATKQSSSPFPPLPPEKGSVDRTSCPSWRKRFSASQLKPRGDPADPRTISTARPPVPAVPAFASDSPDSSRTHT